MSRRILASIDIQALFLSCREEYGPLARVDFVKLMALFSKNQGADTIVDPIAYILASPLHDDRNFVRFLKKLGYITMRKSAQISTQEDNQQKVKGKSWSDSMVWESLKIIDRYDEIFIVSGNGGFCSVAKAAKAAGKKVTVVSFQSSLQSQLSSLADEVIYIDKELIFDSSAFKAKRDAERAVNENVGKPEFPQA
jgi:uncharacterized LabA/DUF88 family protein